MGEQQINDGTALRPGLRFADNSGLYHIGANDIAVALNGALAFRFQTTGPTSPEILTVSKGVAFPATQVASANVNTLDDYEEGTFEFGLTLTTPGDLSVAYSNRAGEYVKIGKMVYVSGWLATSTWTYTTGSGNLTVTGFPFTISSGIYPAGALVFAGITKANYTQFCVVPISGGTTAVVAASGSGQGVDNVQAASVPSGTQQTLRFTCMYMASA